MDYKLNRTLNALAGDQFNFKPGRTSAIALVFSGENATGQTGDLDDLGSIVVTRNDEQIANVSIRQLANMLDINQGSNIFSSTEADSFLATAFLSFQIEGDSRMKNALAISGQSELNFEYVPAAGVDTVFDSLQLKVYAELSASREQYELKTLRDNQNEDSAVAAKSYQLNKSNIASIYIEDIDDVIDSIQLEQSERNVLSPVDLTLLEAETLKNNQLETSSFDMVKISTHTPENPGSYVNYDTVLFVTTSGGGAIDIVTQSLKWWKTPQ